MSARLDVFLLPILMDPDAVGGRPAVVIDVLRATTTAVHAFAAGAERVLPCLEVAEAREKAAAIGALLGGERGGEKIDGFDLGNSPHEYQPASVAGKTICFTTTNGTKALHRARRAEPIFLGAFVNLSAVCDELRRAGGSPVVVCAGTGGEPTREDILLAGAIADDFLKRRENATLNDQAEIARDAWRGVAEDIRSGSPLAEVLRTSIGARNLISIGQERDVEIAAALDRFEIVPRFDAATGEITVG